MQLGDQVRLTSHDYPNYYPPDAYVRWTFHYADWLDSADVIYRIAFGTISLGSRDYLTIGSNTTTFVSYGNYYRGQPDDVLLQASAIFVEFDADSYDQATGFELNIAVEYMTGTNCQYSIVP